VGRRKAVTLIAVVVCVWSLRCAGQANSCISIVSCENNNFYGSSAGCSPTPPASSYGWFTTAPDEAQGQVKNNSCAPPASSDCPTCAGRGIDLSSGNSSVSQTDLQIPGLGGGLTLARTWTSIWSRAGGGVGIGLFGSGWRSTYDEVIFVGSDGYMKYARADGGIVSLGFSGRDNSGNSNPQFSVAGGATGNQTLTLTQLASNWTLVFQNGEQRVFDMTSGKLLAITDRNGNSTNLTYDASFRLIKVTDPASRHLYFSYSSPSSYVVSAVTSDAGISLSYSYDSLGRLSQYTKPDNTKVSFQYNDPNPNLITAVLDNNGKVLESHTYNSCGQGLTSSRAGGVEAITVTYPLACHIGLPVAP